MRILQTIVLASLLGCGAAPPEAPPAMLAVAAAPPAPSAEPKAPERAPSAQEGRNCESKARPRERAFCYLKSDSDASIEPLFAIGRALAVQAAAHPAAYWPDFVYAAENAGVLAAKGHDARLYDGLGSSDESDQLFAVHALRHMLATLRFGYAHGPEADAPVRKERLAAVHAGCAEKLAARRADMVKAASDCLKEIRDPADAAALLDAAVHHPDLKVQSHLVEVASELSPIPKASLKKLVPLLEKKLLPEWTHDELLVKAKVCKLLLQEVPASEAWPRKPAETAVHEIGNRNSQARAPCETLAHRTSALKSAHPNAINEIVTPTPRPGPSR